MGEPIDWYSRIARRKLGVGEDWKWCSLRVVGETDTTLVRGGVPRLKKSGAAKGAPTWRGVTLRNCTITQDEWAAERAGYEASTGNCSMCCGSGLYPSGWSAESGTTYRPCHGCGASGKAKTTAATEVCDG